MLQMAVFTMEFHAAGFGFKLTLSVKKLSLKA